MTIPVSQLPAAGTFTGEEQVLVSQLSPTVTITAATISAAAADNSFNDSGSGFITAGFAVDDYVNVAGFTGNTVNNIHSGKITALTAGKMTIGGTDGDVIVDDAAGESVTITKWTSVRSGYSLSAGSGGALVGQEAEVYRVTLSATQADVTGDGTQYRVPLDTEAEAKSWASLSGGVVTLQAGTYLINGGVLISGDATGDTFTILLTNGAGTNLAATYNSHPNLGSFSQQVERFLEVPQGTTQDVAVEVTVGSTTKNYDATNSPNQTFIEIAKLPVSPEYPAGAFGEVYELTLSATQSNVTGDGTAFTVPYNVEATPRSWANNSGGVVTLDAGTYFVEGAASVIGGTAFADTSGSVAVNGTNKFSEWRNATTTAQAYPNARGIVSLSTTGTVQFKVQVTGDALVGDIDHTFPTVTYLRITRLPEVPREGGNLVLLDEIELTSGGEFDFNNIPAGYRSLVFEGSIRSNVAATSDSVSIFFNEDLTTTNYHSQRTGASNGAASIDESINSRIASSTGANSPANSYAKIRGSIVDYTDSYTKMAFCSSDGYYDTDAIVSRGNSVSSAITAPITRIRIRTDSHPTNQLLGNLRLYGVRDISPGSAETINVFTAATSRTLVAGDSVLVTTATQTMTLPATPKTGDKIVVAVKAFTDTVVARNGELIQGLAEDFTIDVANSSVTFTYYGTTEGWRIQS